MSERIASTSRRCASASAVADVNRDFAAGSAFAGITTLHCTSSESRNAALRPMRQTALSGPATSGGY